MIETSVKQRLIEFLEYKRLGQGKFEKMVGISNGYVSKIKHTPSTAILNKILATFPELNKVWLLTGEGSMTNNDNLPILPSVTDSVADINKALSFTDQYSVIKELQKQLKQKDEEIKFLRNLVSALAGAKQEEPELPHVTNPATDLGIKYYEEMMAEIKSMRSDMNTLKQNAG